MGPAPDFIGRLECGQLGIGGMRDGDHSRAPEDAARSRSVHPQAIFLGPAKPRQGKQGDEHKVGPNAYQDALAPSVRQRSSRFSDRWASKIEHSVSLELLRLSLVAFCAVLGYEGDCGLWYIRMQVPGHALG